MRDCLAEHENPLTCAVQLRAMLRREGAKGNGKGSSNTCVLGSNLVGKPETQLDQHVWIAQGVNDTKRATSWFDFHL